MTWMRLTMSSDEAKGQYNDFQEAYFSAFVAAGAPQDAAMFATNRSASEDAFYFSPAATTLFSVVLKSRGAKPCDKPSRVSVSVLVCNGDAISMLD